MSTHAHTNPIRAAAPRRDVGAGPVQRRAPRIRRRGLRGRTRLPIPVCVTSEPALLSPYLTDGGRLLRIVSRASLGTELVTLLEDRQTLEIVLHTWRELGGRTRTVSATADRQHPLTLVAPADRGASEPCPQLNVAVQTIISCHSCGQRNRIGPVARGVPRCWSCHSMLAWVVDADSDSFELGERGVRPRRHRLLGPWCGPCRMVSPILERLARAHAGKLKLVKVDVDRARTRRPLRGAEHPAARHHP